MINHRHNRLPQCLLSAYQRLLKLPASHNTGQGCSAYLHTHGGIILNMATPDQEAVLPLIPLHYSAHVVNKPLCIHGVVFSFILLHFPWGKALHKLGYHPSGFFSGCFFWGLIPWWWSGCLQGRAASGFLSGIHHIGPLWFPTIYKDHDHVGQADHTPVLYIQVYTSHSCMPHDDAAADFQTVISTSTRVEGPDVLATSENMFVHNKSKNGKTQRKLNPLDASGKSAGLLDVP